MMLAVQRCVRVNQIMVYPKYDLGQIYICAVWAHHFFYILFTNPHGFYGI